MTTLGERVDDCLGCGQPMSYKGAIPGTRRRGGRGYCDADLARLRKYGTVDDPPMVKSMTVQREMLARMATPAALEEGECWEWPEPAPRMSGRGYGLLAPSLTVCRSQLAHRNAYVIAFGALADDLEICHRCDNPPCFRASHLFPGTHADNMQDMAAKGRQVNRLRGSRSPLGKLTESQVREIVALHQSGMTGKDIAPLYPVSHSAITRLLSGKTHYRREFGL